MEFMIGPYGRKYQKYSGKVWISEQAQEKQQGMNVAIVDERNNELRVLGYTVRDDKDKPLDKAVHGILKSYGWFDHHIALLLAEPDEIATCSICHQNFYEGDVNLVDYEDDVCILCEPKYKQG